MKIRKVSAYGVFILALFMGLLFVLPPAVVHADAYGEKSTGKNYEITAVGEYSNWEGVSNVSQFLDSDGNYCFAYNDSKSVVIVKTSNGKALKKTISLKKNYPLFGGVACDRKGNYYLVSGRTNSSNDYGKSTVFISKYDKNGKLIKTVGDHGGSSLASWYSQDFRTKIPFDGGNCDIAVNGDYLTVHYAREMYSGHQSNSVFTINVNTMKKVNVGSIYSSHSFAQRAVPYGGGFVYASEGDCYSRAFTITAAPDPSSGTNTESDIFHFWVEKNALNNWDMFALNDNFAHMGALLALDKSRVALVGTSAKSLTSNAASENEQLFIQIFDPSKNLDSSVSYVTSGKRTGYSGPNGDERVTDYGVKWLTNLSGKYSISYPQAVSDGKGNIIILYELYENYSYKGVYYMVVNKSGKVTVKRTRYSAQARLNPCEMPVYAKNTVYWTGNKYNDSKRTMYIYRLKIA